MDFIGDVLIVDGMISQIGDHLDGYAYNQSIDASGLIVCPGFIDLHCHLREPGFEEKETIASGSKAAARGGFTTICCMPNTNPPLDSCASLEAIKRAATTSKYARVLPIACVTKGREGREIVAMSDLAASGAVAFSDDGSPVSDDMIMRQALEQSKGLGLPIIDHCEDTALSANGSMNAGAVARSLGYKGIPVAAEERLVERDIRLARETGGHVHVAHASTRGSVKLIRRAKKDGINITAEATPHHLTLTEEEVVRCGSKAKVNPPLRKSDDVEALINGLQDGTIDLIATDHAPHTIADKASEFSQSAFGISVFETALGSLMSLVSGQRITLGDLIFRLTRAPANLLGRSSKCGSLQRGMPADMTIFDPEVEWTVDTERFVSKGKNTPLDGCTLRGQVIATIIGGHIAYSKEKL